MAKRLNGEGSWGTTMIKGHEYVVFQVMIGNDRKKFYGKTQTEAHKKYKAYLKDRDNSPVKNALTLRQIAEMMLENRKAQIKPTTYDGYMFEIKRIQESKIGKMQIATIKATDIQRHIDDMALDRSYSAIKSHRVVLKMSFDYAVSAGYIKDNPMRDVHLPNKANVVKETREPVFLTTDERHLIEEEAENSIYTGNSAKAIVFILHTGLRISELTALTWDDIDFTKERMYIRKNAPVSKNYGEKYSAKVTTPKRESSRRTVPLDKTAIGIVKGLHDTSKSDFVFSNTNGGMLARRNVYRTLENIVKRSGIDKTPSLHDLRHTFASELIRNGLDMKKVSQILGHSSVTTTMNIYVHNSDDDLDVLKDVLK